MESNSDTSLFVYRRDVDTAYLLLYIDDIVRTASSPELLQHTTTTLGLCVYRIVIPLLESIEQPFSPPNNQDVWTDYIVSCLFLKHIA
jgi:hypothetical protein